MNRLAGAFAALVLVALVLAAAILIRPAPLFPPPAVPLSGPVDRIVVEKSARRLTLWQDGAVVRVYRVALGTSPVGDKQRQGDGRTPEGHFRIDRRNEASAYHLSLGLSYPRPEDRARAAAGGYDPGGDIMIHGQPNTLPSGLMMRGDWTAGCIALTNAQMREIWPVAPIGTPVELRP